jgi:hypothetical protein
VTFFIFHNVTRYKNKIQFKKIFLTTILFFGVFFVFFNANFYDNTISFSSCYAEEQSAQTDVEVTGNYFKQVIAAIFIAIIRVFALIINISVSLIELTLTPTFMTIITNDGIYIGWKTVRDVLNMFFIFFLLYSAFCTIFQISRYHIKSTWVMIVVMALLVNFSWPVARVMIDLSNVVVYHVVGSSGSGPASSNGIMGKMANETQFLSIVLGGVGTPDLVENTFKINADASNVFTSLFVGIIASALFAITVGMIGIILVIRIIALAVYLVFASVGFTMAAFPSTRSYANQWWTGFTKQLIIGPVVLFGLLLAVTVLEKLNQEKLQEQMQNVASQHGIVSTFLSYLVSLMIIWASVIAAQRVGSEGASFAVGLADKAKGKLQGYAKGATVSALKMADTATGRIASKTAAATHGLYGGVKQRFKNSDDAYKSKYTSTRDGVSARVQQAGTNIGQEQSDPRWKKAAGAVLGYGGDKNAVAANKGKQIEAEKKSMKETPLNMASDIEAEAKAQNLIDKKDGVKEQDIRDLIASLDKLDENTKKAAVKKARETGNGHIAYDAHMASLEGQISSGTISRPDAHRQSFNYAFGENVDGKTWIKNKEMVRRAADDPQYVHAAMHLQNKLDRVGFARDVANADVETYNRMSTLNGTYL